MTSEIEDLDFLGDSSMKDLAMRMDEIDKAIEAMHEVDKGSPQKKEGGDESPAKGANYYETPEEASAKVEDIVLGDDEDDDDDDGDAGLSDLQKEMEQFEAQQEEVSAEVPVAGGEIITVTCVKPTVTSAIGISMKTSKGITKIIAVNPNGLFAESDLRPGLQLIQVNAVDVRNAKHAKFIIDNHPGTITLVTKTIATQ